MKLLEQQQNPMSASAPPDKEATRPNSPRSDRLWLAACGGLVFAAGILAFVLVRRHAKE